MLIESIAIILIQQEPKQYPELPPPTETHVYCWIKPQRDSSGRLNGFVEDCRDE